MDAGLSREKLFVRVKIYKRDVICRALIDSGNMFGCIMSESFRKKLGIPIVDHEKPEVGTVNKSGTLKILGRTGPVSFFIENIQASMTIQPWVAEGVRHPLNLGREFLSQAQMDARFRPEGSVLQHKGDSVRFISKREPLLSARFIDARFKRVTDKLHKIPLTRFSMSYFGYATEQEEGPWQGEVYSLEKQEVPPNSMAFINVVIPSAPGGNNDLLIEPELKDGTLSDTGLMLCKGVYPVIQDVGKVMVLNPGPETVKVEAQAKLGTAAVDFSLAAEEPIVGELSHKPTHKLSARERIERTRFIEEKLKINDNKILRRQPGLKRQVTQVFLENFDAIAIDDSDFGKTSLMEFDIKLEDGAQPVRHRVKPLNPSQEASLQKQINDWEKADVIDNFSRRMHG